MPEPALKQTRVYTFNADYIPYWEYFDPTKDNGLHEVELVRKLLEQPEEKIDLARFKLAIDKLVSPDIDISKALKEIDAMVRRIKAMPEFGATATSKAIALQRFIYTAGPWNGNLPFEYDLDDPLGSNPNNKLLTTYMSSRKGNCVTMPFLFIVLGQRLAMESGIYLQPLTKKETAAVMAGFLAEHYFRQEQYQRAIAAADLLLEHYPKDVTRITMKGAAYGRLARKYFIEKFPTPNQIPPAQRWYYDHLSRSNQLWFARAEALGWQEETREAKEAYLQSIKAMRNGTSRH